MNTSKKICSIAIKTAQVDKKIIPVVKWLNKLDGVFTLFSCEGHGQKPYVLFLCLNTLSLIKILEKTKYLAEITVDFYNGSIRYTMRFTNKAELSNFKKLIK